jgi:hypothetical protein
VEQRTAGEARRQTTVEVLEPGESITV